ncbi:MULTISPECIES: hypothetical protein [unclassified Fusobacterium]|uniref:hypothetical protein n=1 Tax=unclassified Fusobacterium TaxID=2648384 RepID=UPI0025C28A35|nr:hypothetical protein [Fusobacterium sp.]
MKTFLLFIAIISFSLTGCTSINNFIDENLPKKNPTIPIALQEQIATKINPENELFAVGYSGIDKSGALIAQAKANKNAKELLKEQIKKEVKINFNTFMLNTDTYSKGIISPVLNDLSDYVIDLSLKSATQKGAWENDSSVYSLFAVDREKINQVSKQVFTGYLSDISGKLNNIKNKIGDIQIGAPIKNGENQSEDDEIID